MIRFLMSIFLLFFSSSAVYAGSVDVLIKGVDDGVKTNKQQDHKEAVMNAKLQAIERAGVEVSSITRIENFQMKFDKVESQASGVLEPGFSVMDLGYQVDGTYQIVLSGKVNSGKGTSSLGEGVKVGVHVLYADAGVVVDEGESLMWMRVPMSRITEKGPSSYDEVLGFVQLVNSRKYAGFNDWRVPSSRELHTITKYQTYGYYIIHRDYPLFFEEPFRFNEQMRKPSMYWTSSTSSGYYKLVGSSGEYWGQKSRKGFYHELPERPFANNGIGEARLVRNVKKKSFFEQ